VRRIPEHSVLIGVVVERIGAARGILDPDAIVQISPGPVIVHLPRYTALLKARLNRVEASTVDRRVALLESGAALCVNIDDACIAESKLRGQRASNQRNAVRETGFQNLAKTGNTFWDKHVVDAV